MPSNELLNEPEALFDSRLGGVLLNHQRLGCLFNQPLPLDFLAALLISGALARGDFVEGAASPPSGRGSSGTA
jgi:hypothetical protein